ncbi:hypothetical protein [Marinactinospora rubrisoli]|uniref:Uncharacterized protein n=1 Tax=Marinactinospora rubrisoli TaxID=2715399 RepID=A0ABW2KN23_9ACTN
MTFTPYFATTAPFEITSGTRASGITRGTVFTGAVADAVYRDGALVSVDVDTDGRIGLAGKRLRVDTPEELSKLLIQVPREATSSESPWLYTYTDDHGATLKVSEETLHVRVVSCQGVEPPYEVNLPWEEEDVLALVRSILAAVSLDDDYEVVARERA